MPGQVVDTASAREFMKEIAAKISPQDLESLVASLVQKSDLFFKVLGEGRAKEATPQDLTKVLKSIFSSRRRVDKILSLIPPAELALHIDQLLHGSQNLPERFERFNQIFADFPELSFDLPSEFLHFTYPDQYWLWTRWMWDPRTETGSLTLVTTEEFDLHADGRGAAYLKVGEAVAFVSETGKAVGFTTFGEGLFGLDVYLACVYSVYMYTVLRLRMSQEFNRIVPQMPSLVRRLLGVHNLEVV